MSNRGGRSYGNFKLNGKKYRILSCGCCVVENVRHDTLVKDMNKQIREFRKNQE